MRLFKLFPHHPQPLSTQKHRRRLWTLLAVFALMICITLMAANAVDGSKVGMLVWPTFVFVYLAILLRLDGRLLTVVIVTLVFFACPIVWHAGDLSFKDTSQLERVATNKGGFPKNLQQRGTTFQMVFQDDYPLSGDGDTGLYPPMISTFNWTPYPHYQTRKALVDSRASDAESQFFSLRDFRASLTVPGPKYVGSEAVTVFRDGQDLLVAGQPVAGHPSVRPVVPIVQGWDPYYTWAWALVLILFIIKMFQNVMRPRLQTSSSFVASTPAEREHVLAERAAKQATRRSDPHQES